MYNDEFFNYNSKDINSNLKFINKPIKLKLGKIDLEELRTYNKLNRIKDEDNYYITYVEANVSHSKTLIVEEEIDKMSDFSTNSADKVDCYYLIKNENMEKVDNHWFVINNEERLKKVYLVKFKTISKKICDICDKESNELLYCQNDKKYFCKNCDEEYHTNNDFSNFSNHIRDNYYSYSINYMINCKLHNTKPYEFYCYDCRLVYCIKCLTENTHTQNHEIKYIDHVLQSIEYEKKSVHLILFS